MNRRDILLTTFGVVAALPAGTRAQQPALPLIGFLSVASATQFAHLGMNVLRRSWRVAAGLRTARRNRARAR